MEEGGWIGGHLRVAVGEFVVAFVRLHGELQVAGLASEASFVPYLEGRIRNRTHTNTPDIYIILTLEPPIKDTFLVRTKTLDTFLVRTAPTFKHSIHPLRSWGPQNEAPQHVCTFNYVQTHTQTMHPHNNMTQKPTGQ